MTPLSIADQGRGYGYAFWLLRSSAKHEEVGTSAAGTAVGGAALG
jgi:hypothetical protein